MNVAILSDIHSNLEALRAVLQHLDHLHVDKIVCLGDVVGYNADPEECLQLVLARCDAVVRGNHDKAVGARRTPATFTTVARDAADWSRRTLRHASHAALRRIPRGPMAIDPATLICHGTPMDEDTYLVSTDLALRAFSHMRRRHPGVRVCFFGHTHVPVAIASSGSMWRPVPGATQCLLSRYQYLINPGSVGQPRDGDPRAAFATYDSEQLLYTGYRIPYNIPRAAQKVTHGGLPSVLSERLYYGK